jgi:low temperature requirement protein LtrA
VFVFAVSQLSHHLLAHLSWRGAAETLVLLLAVYAVWFSTSWQATVIGADEPQTRRMLLTVMLLGLFMNAAVTGAFDTSGWIFVIPLLLIQLGRTSWTLVNAPDEVFRDHYVRTLLWLVATAPLWIVGAAVNPEDRLRWWALAAGIDLVGRGLAHPVPGRRLHSMNVGFRGGHLVERCQLFLLIALGETVLATGTAIAGASMTLMTIVTGTVALVGIVSLWALGFGRGGRRTVEFIEMTSDPVLASRHAGDALTMMVAGLIALAAANEEVIAHPQEPAFTILSVLLFGGPILFLLAQVWYFRVVLHDQPGLHLFGVVALLLGGVATLTAPLYVGLILVGAILGTTAIFDRP